MMVDEKKDDSALEDGKKKQYEKMKALSVRQPTKTVEQCIWAQCPNIVEK